MRTNRSYLIKFSMFLTSSFLLDLFNISEKENNFIPKFTHNAIPIDLRDFKEIYKIIYNSKPQIAFIEEMKYFSFKYL